MTRALAGSTLVLFLLACAGPSGPDSVAGDGEPVFIEGLGALSFPNSGAAEAQDDFRRGVLLLHSFEYEPAAERCTSVPVPSWAPTDWFG